MPKPMKITKVEPLLLDRYLFVKVHTDAGITGIGESGAWGFLEASEAVVEKFGATWSARTRCGSSTTGSTCIAGATSAARRSWARFSAIDIALWDIAGKHFGVPVYQLLGGKIRDKARVYYHVFGDTREQLVQGCIDAKAAGFTAVGHLTPFLDEPRDVPYFEDARRQDGRRHRHGAPVPRGGRRRGRPVHRDPPPADAARGGRAGARHRAVPPVLLRRPDPARQLRRDGRWSPSKIHIPIATGERLHTIYEFEMLLARNAVQYVRPDVCMCGGITGAKKIAALAEARHVGVVPHNPLSPVSTAACLQIAACIPNFALQEYPTARTSPPKSDMVTGIQARRPGFPDHPRHAWHRHGTAARRAEKCPMKPREVVTRLHVDGSVVDQ